MDESHATAKGNLGGSTLNGPPPSSAVTIINIDGNKYLLQLDAPVLSVGTLNVRDGRQYVPATSFGGLVKEAKDPEEVMRTFGEDDVWTKEFLSCKFLAMLALGCESRMSVAFDTEEMNKHGHI